jgi:hypothetical protein
MHLTNGDVDMGFQQIRVLRISLKKKTYTIL